MTDFEQDIDQSEHSRLGFDFRGYLFKALNWWRLVVFCVGIALLTAYFINVRKQNIYKLSSLISVENDTNPFFTANTSIQFNWGGVSGKVGKVMTTVKTRNHNELVVDSLKFYMNYLQQDKYFMKDVYGDVPFNVEIDKQKGQLLGKMISIIFKDDSSYELSVDFEGSIANLQRYSDKYKYATNVTSGLFTQEFKVGEPVNLPFFSGTIYKISGTDVSAGDSYFIQFLNFDSVVNQYKNNINIIAPSNTVSSVLELSLAGTNKAKIVDYLNATSAILSRTELERKNLYATNTIKFIDSSLNTADANVRRATEMMNEFRKQKKVFDLNDEMLQTNTKLKELDGLKEVENAKLKYLNSLEDYLRTKTDYTKIAAPSSVGIQEANIMSSVSTLTGLAIERQSLEYTTKEGSILFKELDRRIDAEKNVLLETIGATKRTINEQLISINKRIGRLESELSKLPEDQQEYLKIERTLSLSQEAYEVYLAKRGEAAIVRAANVSDIVVIDEAKDIGNGPIGPKKSLNYMMALMVGFLSPMFLIFVVYLLDNTIQGSDEVEKLSKIPIIGLVGKYNYKNNLVVYEKPKSAIAESFRAIRSSLQFIYKNQPNPDKKGRSLMVTSSVSGEGKTFCSINMAIAYALSGKKTILLGLDLRKPKIFGDFNIPNKLGIVNYLIGDNTLEEVTLNSHIKNLDVIPSGPIPPNPSEILMGDNLKDLIAHLRNTYDIIVMDTPPLGLVSDALELSNFADATIFLVRLNYTKKGMLSLVNAKHRTGELNSVYYLLNFYKHKSNRNYGYSYGYGYGVYGNAYHERDNNDFWTRLKRVFKRLK